MIKSYFLTTWRNLLKNKFYSFLNIAGLTIGLSIGLLILLWVQDERSYDKFHRQANDIYRVQNRVGTGTSQQIWTVTNAPVGTAAKARLPEVKGVVRITGNNRYTSYRYNDKTFTESGALLTDPALFTLFDFNLIKGSSTRPFPDNRSIVMTEKTARRYFGDADPIGKVVLTNDKTSYTVSGVIKDIPKNSSIQGDIFFSMGLLNDPIYNNGTARNIDNEWEEFDFTTYLLLQPGTSTELLADKLRNIHLEHEPKDTDIKYLIQKLGDTHLYRADGTDGGIGTVRIFTIIALLILVIACINYVNLSTARSVLRAKEISVRKIIGAGRGQLFIQFILETAFLFLFALALSLLLIVALLPLFNRLSGKELVLNFSDLQMWQLIGCAGAGTLLISSIYPALLLSSFEPLKALKGKMAAGIRDVTFRRALVICQFTISVSLITGTIIISKQLSYMRSKDLGYDKDHTLSVFMPDNPAHYDAIKGQLAGETAISGVTNASSNIAWMGNQTGDNAWDGKGKDETVMVYPLSIDKDFIPFFKIQLLQGNNFTGSPADSLHFILNETAVKQTGIKDPIGKRFRMWQFNGIITGVVKDFHFTSLKQKIQPAVLYYQPQRNSILYVKTNARDAAKAVAAVNNVWNRYHAGTPFEYHFLDEIFDEMYRTEQRSGRLFNVFAGIAIFVSCLGLLGLAAYTAQVRTREIGVRKVLGAGITGIVRLLTMDFLKLVLIAILIAVPVSWYAMSKWLDGFAYRIPINWSVFLLSGVIAIVIALLTIGFQSVKAALANPVKSLSIE